MLGINDTPVSASEGCGRCSGSPPMLSAEQIGGQTHVGMGIPMKKMGSALPSVTPCTRPFASPNPRVPGWLCEV